MSYVNAHERVAQDTRRFRELSGLDVVELWLQTRPGHALDADFLRAVEALGERLESDPRITAVDGPTSVLRWAHYVQAGSDRLPAAREAWPKLAADLEQILLTEPGARGYVDMADLASVRLSVRGRAELFGSPGAMRTFIARTVSALQAQEPALRDVRAQTVGRGVLAAQISERLVPTLTESFGLTASVIFVAFLFVFRSPAGRLMAMIPSLFAILRVFLVMRGAGIPLNIATILIGSTVLGATENDQIHFFYHLQQGRARGATAAALRHALTVPAARSCSRRSSMRVASSRSHSPTCRRCVSSESSHPPHLCWRWWPISPPCRARYGSSAGRSGIRVNAYGGAGQGERYCSR